MKKKRLAVIKPTLRHKKRYIEIRLLTFPQSLDPKTIYGSLTKALQKNSGIFVQLETNITIIETDQKLKTVLVRINKECLSDFISSLFFAQSDLGLIKVKALKSTIKKINLK